MCSSTKLKGNWDILNKFVVKLGIFAAYFRIRAKFWSLAALQSNADAMLRTVMQRLDVRASVNAVNAERETALLKAARQGWQK